VQAAEQQRVSLTACGPTSASQTMNAEAHEKVFIPIPWYILSCLASPSYKILAISLKPNHIPIGINNFSVLLYEMTILHKVLNLHFHQYLFFQF